MGNVVLHYPRPGLDAAEAGEDEDYRDHLASRRHSRFRRHEGGSRPQHNGGGVVGATYLRKKSSFL